jgi:hypothetical protein
LFIVTKTREEFWTAARLPPLSGSAGIESVKIREIRVIDFGELKSARHAGLLLQNCARHANSRP